MRLHKTQFDPQQKRNCQIALHILPYRPNMDLTAFTDLVMGELAAID